VHQLVRLHICVKSIRCPLQLMYNYIATHSHKNDTFMYKMLGLKFNKFHYNRKVVANVTLYNQIVFLLYDFDQCQLILFTSFMKVAINNFDAINI
jgi:hypothetical protein